MSVRTAADHRLAEARGHVQKAVESLSAIVVERCCGVDGYNAAAQADFRRVFAELVRIRDEL